MSELDVIINAVSTTAFPIVMSILLLKYLEESDKRREEQNNALVEAINNLTLFIKGGNRNG